MVPQRAALILLVVASGDAALLNRVAQRLSHVGRAGARVKLRRAKKRNTWHKK